MRGTYPSGGITLGPAMVFAYRAVESIAVGTTSDKPGRQRLLTIVLLALGSLVSRSPTAIRSREPDATAR